MEGDTHLDILGNEGPGSSPESPLALVYSDPPPVPLTTEPHVSPRVVRGRRPLASRATSQVVAKPPGWIRVQSNYKRTSFSVVLQVLVVAVPHFLSCHSGTMDTEGWLTYEKGDILYASGVEEIDDSGKLIHTFPCSFFLKENSNASVGLVTRTKMQNGYECVRDTSWK